MFYKIAKNSKIYSVDLQLSFIPTRYTTDNSFHFNLCPILFSYPFSAF